MTDETTQAQPESGDFPASDTPEMENVAPDTTPDVAEEAEDEQPPQDKPKGGFQRRIAELVSERNEYRRMLEQDRRRLDQLVELVAGQRQVAPESPKAEPTPPTLEQAGYDEQKYQQALVEYARAEARKEVQQTLRQEREQAQAQTRQESFKTREADFAKQVEDYADVVYDPTAPISQTMAELIAESDVGPQLAYHLAKHREVAQAIYSLPPVAAARELGRLEAKLATPEPKSSPAIPKAPPPPPRVEAIEPEVERDPDKMTDAEWLKWRNKQLSAARARSFRR